MTLGSMFSACICSCIILMRSRVENARPVGSYTIAVGFRGRGSWLSGWPSMVYWWSGGIPSVGVV